MELIESGLAGMEIIPIPTPTPTPMVGESSSTPETRPMTRSEREAQSAEILRHIEEMEEMEQRYLREHGIYPREQPTEEQEVENYRKYWEKCFGRRHGSYDAETSLGPMSGDLPESSLQFFSIKVTDLKYGLRWPLQVYGFVAARDSVDRRRNYLFRCTKDTCQTLTKNDPYLRLTGPSRAVLMIDPVAIEVQLKVKTETESEEDNVLALDCFQFHETYPLEDGIRARIPRRRCTLEFALEVLGMSVETIVGIRVIGGSWPDQCAGLIVCSTEKAKDERMVFLEKGNVAPASASSEGRMVLLDFPDGKLPTKSDGTVELSRRIVSVHWPAGKLVVSVEASREGFYARDTVDFGMKKSGASTCICDLIFCRMEVTVTWSLVSM